MIQISIERVATRVINVTISGHSGFARHGKDIVCAAVSAVSYTCLLGLMRFSKESVEYEVDEKTGYLRFTVPKGGNDEETGIIDAIVETMLIGLKDIETGYKNCVKVVESDGQGQRR